MPSYDSKKEVPPPICQFLKIKNQPCCSCQQHQPQPFMTQKGIGRWPYCQMTSESRILKNLSGCSVLCYQRSNICGLLITLFLKYDNSWNFLSKLESFYSPLPMRLCVKMLSLRSGVFEVCRHSSASYNLHTQGLREGCRLICLWLNRQREIARWSQWLK